MRKPTPSASALKFRIPSDFSACRHVQQRILELLGQCGYDSDSVFAIKLGLEEGLINAVKHGNKLDPSKHVRIEANISAEQAEICIEDEGPGFDRTCVPDPTATENIEKCSGRGILLIEAYMNQVEWSKGGRRLRMVKVNETPSA